VLQVEGAMEGVARLMAVVLMVDMVQQATNKPHCGRFSRGMLLNVLTFCICYFICHVLRVKD